MLDINCVSFSHTPKLNLSDSFTSWFSHITRNSTFVDGANWKIYDYMPHNMVDQVKSYASAAIFVVIGIGIHTRPAYYLEDPQKLKQLKLKYNVVHYSKYRC